jgi:predicted oxidoreductase
MEVKEPCIDCSNKIIDDFGYFCDIACGERTAWLNFKAGIRKVVEWIEQEHIVVRPDANSISQFHPYYIIPVSELESKLKEWGI